MKVVEFEAQLSGGKVLDLPEEVAAMLPRSGRVRVIVLTEQDSEDAAWRSGAYEQFLRDDSEDDAIYESMR